MPSSSSEDSEEEEAAAVAGQRGASSADGGSGPSSDEGDSSSSDSEEPAPTGGGGSGLACPDCGGTFVDSGGILTCRCGTQRPVPAVTPPARATRAGRTASGKKKAKPPPKVTKSQKFLAEVSGRLSTGVPNFVLKDAHQLYSRALKSEERKGCSDIGLALAALEHALRKHKLEPPRPELIVAANNKVALAQLNASSEVLQRLANDAFPDQTPSAAHFASKLCEDLLEPQKVRERGAWCKAAEAVAQQAAELRAGVDSPPLTLAAAICILVFERHTPKEKITTERVAKAAGQQHSHVIDCFTQELLPYMHELLEASQEARRHGPEGRLWRGRAQQASLLT